MINNDINLLPDWMHFIGKWGDSETGHPLAFHLLDSAAVAGLLWQQGLTRGAREQISNWLQLPEETCCSLLAFWTGLHDLGKAAPSFQTKHSPTRGTLEKLGYPFPEIPSHGIRHHSLLSQWILKDFQQEIGIQPVGAFNRFRFAIGGHHGSYHFAQEIENSIYPGLNLGGTIWQNARGEMFHALTDLLKPPELPSLKLNQTQSNAFFNLLTGFFVTADWVSSADEFFPYASARIDLPAYWRMAQNLAEKALSATGWIGWQPDTSTVSFFDMFGFQPNDLQQSISEITKNIDDPFLLIIEAPTGSGKTEAALSIADRVIQNHDLRGLYVAMPSQATSNQMFNRTRDFLSRRYPDQQVINLQLVHGNALIDHGFQKIRLHSVEDLDANQEGNINALEWFLPRKRSLLAPFGVGTVDQTFLSVLRARHSFLRLFGLSRKVIIFDEVHAYDVYMQKIFTRLLAWLRALGTSVIILSATLPDATRQELLQAWQPEAQTVSANAGYPRLSLNDGKKISTLSLGQFPDRTVQLEHITEGSAARIALLRDRLSDGGCAAVICNRVSQAQQVYQQIRDAALVADEDLFLLHARTPYCWRKKTEDEILRRFGKRLLAPTSPRRGIVVATQVIEQSLDLDFDLLITEMAPVDLLIQRIGRLHRHTGKTCAPVRPDELAQPVCVLSHPAAPSPAALPDFGPDNYIYANAVLQRTCFVLAGRNALHLPSDSDSLINTVYGETNLPECSREQNEKIRLENREMRRKQENEISAARNRLIGDVDWENALGGKADYLKETDQDISEAMRALTRNNVLPSVQLICLTREGNQICTLSGKHPCSIDAIPDEQMIEHLLSSAVNVTLRDVVQHFQGQPKNPAWQKTPALRNYYPVVFTSGTYFLNEKRKLMLDAKIGLLLKESDD